MIVTSIHLCLVAACHAVENMIDVDWRKDLILVFVHSVLDVGQNHLTSSRTIIVRIGMDMRVQRYGCLDAVGTVILIDDTLCRLL
jgi:hypothetical protein